MDCSQLEHEMDETETSLDQCAQDDHCDEDRNQLSEVDVPSSVFVRVSISAWL